MKQILWGKMYLTFDSLLTCYHVAHTQWYLHFLSRRGHCRPATHTTSPEVSHRNLMCNLLLLSRYQACHSFQKGNVQSFTCFNSLKRVNTFGRDVLFAVRRKWHWRSNGSQFHWQSRNVNRLGPLQRNYLHHKPLHPNQHLCNDYHGDNNRMTISPEDTSIETWGSADRVFIGCGIKLYTCFKDIM